MKSLARAARPNQDQGEFLPTGRAEAKPVVLDEKSTERFWGRVERAETGCWLWTGWKSNRGYGVLYLRKVKGKRFNILAHRYSYTLNVGPFPDELTIDHLCRVPLCVNPAHLEPVTSDENVRRAFAGRTHCPQGHEYTPENTYMNAKRWKRCKTCVRKRQRLAYHEKKAS